MTFVSPGNISGRFGRVLYKIQVSGRMRLRHKRTILTARPTVADPWRILVPRYTNTPVERTPAQPTEQYIFEVELIAVPTLFFA